MSEAILIEINSKVDDALAGFAKVNDALAKKMPEAGKTGTNAIIGSLTELKSGIELVGMSVETLKGVWDFAREGASIERIGQQFENLGKSVGWNTKQLLSDLDKAAHGTVDDEALMQTATRAMATGITTDQNQIVKLMEISRASSVAFGGDTTDAFNRISMAIENMTPKALKNAGIIVNLKQANEDWAKANGKVVESMTDEEKRQALLNQVLVKGGDLVKKIGDTGDDTATKMDRFTRNIKEAKDKVEEFFASGVSAGIDILNRAQTNLDMYNQRVKDLTKLVVDGKMSVADYNTEIDREAKLLDVNQLAMDSSGEAQANQNLLTDESVQLLRAQAVAVTDASDRLRGLAAANDKVTLSTKEQADALKAQNTAWESQLKVEAAISTEDKKYSASQKDLIDKADDLRDEIAKLTKANGAVVTSHKDSTLSIDERTAAEAKLLVVEEDLTQHQKRKSETDLEFKARMDGLVVTADRLRSSLDGATKIGSIDNSKEIGKLQTELETANQAVLNNRIAHDEATKHIVYDYAFQQMAVNGFTTTEQAALDLLSKQFGFTSDSSEAMALKIIGATNKLATDGNIGAFDNTMLAMTGRVNTNLDSIKDHLDQTQAKIDALHDKDINISISISGMEDLINASDLLNSGNLGGGAGQQGTAPTAPKPKKEPIKPKPKGGGGGIQAAAGIDFIVPPGYPNDSFPMRVQSGEHVRVTPAGQMNSGTGGGMTQNNNITINDPINSAIWYAKIYGDQRAMLDALM